MKLIWKSDVLAADLEVAANDITSDTGLQGAVLLSLFTDRRADDGDVLPAGELTRRGWWADAVPVEPGDQHGSLLWLLAREKETPDVLSRAVSYAEDALEWLVADGVAERVGVEAEFIAGRGLGLAVSITRPGQAGVVRFRFGQAWETEAGVI